MKKNRLLWILTAISLLLATVFSVLVCTVDVRETEIGGKVGFASLNLAVRNRIGYRESLYHVTQALGYFAFLVVAFFAGMGVWNLIMGKSLRSVPRWLYVLGGFYLLVGAVYVLFEKVALNYRPVILDGVPEPSYPSSHTVLALCVFLSAALLLPRLLPERKKLRLGLQIGAYVLAFAIVILRLLSGVHWISDIIGGIVISASLLMLFYTMLRTVADKTDK